MIRWVSVVASHSQKKKKRREPAPQISRKNGFPRGATTVQRNEESPKVKNGRELAQVATTLFQQWMKYKKICKKKNGFPAECHGVVVRHSERNGGGREREKEAKYRWDGKLLKKRTRPSSMYRQPLPFFFFCNKS